MNIRDVLLRRAESLRIEHRVVGADGYYSCPKSPTYEGRLPPIDRRCNCEADEHNERLDKLISLILENV